MTMPLIAPIRRPRQTAIGRRSRGLKRRLLLTLAQPERLPVHLLGMAGGLARIAGDRASSWLRARSGGGLACQAGGAPPGALGGRAA